MNLLFIYETSRRDLLRERYFLLLIRYFAASHMPVGLYTNSPQLRTQVMDDCTLLETPEFDAAYWEIILLQGTLSDQLYTCLNDDGFDIPIVFFAHAHDAADETPCLKTLAGIVRTKRSYMPEFNQPDELVEVIPYPVTDWAPVTANKTADKYIKLVYVEEDGGLNNIRQLIAVINPMPGVQLTIYCNPRLQQAIAAYANDNIHFLPVEEHAAHLPLYDIVLCSGHIAATSVYNGLPTIIMGPCGFGGLVEMSNIYTQLEHGFPGRIGGSLQEPVPATLLRDEISITADLVKQSSAIFHEPAAVIKEKNSLPVIGNLLKTRFHSIIQQFSQMKHATGILALRPAVSNSVHINVPGNGNGHSETTFYLFRKNSGKLLGTVESREHKILAALNGQKNIQQVCLELVEEMDENTLICFIQDLWKEKIIYFKN